MSKDNRDGTQDEIEPQVPLPIVSAPAEPNDDNEPVSIATFLTRADRTRLNLLGANQRLSVQRMGHRAWNLYLAAHGQPGLTPVFTGRQGKKPKS